MTLQLSLEVCAKLKHWLFSYSLYETLAEATSEFLLLLFCVP